MKARLPQGYGSGSNNLQQMMKQVQKAQEDMQTKQAELETTEYTATSGGGMVEVTVTGKHQVTRLSIKPEIVDPDDIEMLEDLITAAINEAMRTADSTGEEEMAKISSALNIPNIPGMGGLFLYGI